MLQSTVAKNHKCAYMRALGAILHEMKSEKK